MYLYWNHTLIKEQLKKLPSVLLSWLCINHDMNKILQYDVRAASEWI